MKSATLIESTELLLIFLILVFLLAHCYFLSCYFFSYLPTVSFISCHFIHTATQMNCYLFSCFFFSHLSTVTFFPVTFFPVTFFPTWNCYFLSCYFLSVHHTGVVGTAIRNSTSCAGRRAAACGRAGPHNQCCSGLQYQPLQRRPYKWSISILPPQSQFTKSKGNLRFRRLVPLFVPIGVYVTTHDDGTACDATIGMWRHNQQVTKHERNGKPWFSLPK